MKLDIISDTICPWCYIGKRRLERALARHPQPRLSVVWRPFRLNPAMPATGMDREQYLVSKFGGAERARSVYDAVARAGRAEGIEFAFQRIRRTPQTLHSHRLIRFAGARGLQDEAVEALFAGYFLDGLDIGEIEVLLTIGESIGLGEKKLRAYLVSEADAGAVGAEEAKAREFGVDAVPCYIVNGKFVIAGAQSPEAFARVFELARAGEAEHGKA